MTVREVSMAEISVDQVLDAKGLNCPMPVIKTKKALNDIQEGQVLKVVSTDPGSNSDIPALVKRLGHELLDTQEEAGVISFYIKKK
jgi:tRNA 2-thiouridine synthesizing protein A